MTHVQVLERLTIVAPLGLRFRDQVTGSFIGDGLNVSLYEPNKPGIKVQAFANRSGVYVVHHAPGLADFERGAGGDNFWNSQLPKRSFVVAVTDAERRFQPFQFATDLPVRGIFNWVSPLGISPPTVVPSIPLYSSPVRSVPAGMAVLRADLWDAVNRIPAAWAVLEAYTNNQLVARGIADDQGRIALIFPHPAPRPFAISSPPDSPLSSPPAATGLPLTNQFWPIQLRGRYAPIGPLHLLTGEFGQEPELPDLRVMLSQPEATLWADTECTEPLGEVPLSYGRELILKSRPSTSLSPPARQSALLIKPAVSPP
jgi:hypothetical protein